MQQWYFQQYTYSPDEVQVHCVQDEAWQKFRKTLKGMPTTLKLDRLEAWIYTNTLVEEGASSHLIKGRKIQVQVSNYINALKRGGQLSMDLKVQR
jgi:hypothetical protein